MTTTSPDVALDEPVDVIDAAGPLTSHDLVRIPRGDGFLTFRPGTTDLTPEQRTAFLALGLNPDLPDTVPHALAFVHMCQQRGLDPWAKEAYLIRREGRQGKPATFTMQVGIDGFRKMAAATRRQIGGARWLWTGADDDPSSWWRNPETGIMERTWWDEWPESRGYPGAARAIVSHYDESGFNLTSTDAIALWSMYAPFMDKKAWVPGPNGRDVPRPVLDADGKPVQVLNEMWTKGHAHMLAKCAEALALRKAFPASMAGVYAPEEMQRLDAETRAAQARVAHDARAEARAAARKATAPARGPAPAATAGEAPAAAEEEATGPEPTTVADDAVLLEQARAVIKWQAEVLGTSVVALTQRWCDSRRRKIVDATGPELVALTGSYKAQVLAALEAAGQHGVAAAYADAPPMGPLDVMRGAVEEPQPGPAPTAGTAGDDGPPPVVDEPHAFGWTPEQDNDACTVCGRYADHDLHAGLAE